MLMRARADQVFTDHISRLIRNLLVKNKNFVNGHYSGSDGAYRLIKDVQDMGNHILEQIDRTKHLVEEPDCQLDKIDHSKEGA